MRKRAAAFGAQLADRRREAGERMQLLAHLVGRERDEVDLDIGRCQARTGLEERARGAGGDRQRPLAQGRALHARHHLAHRMIDDIVERDASASSASRSGPACDPADRCRRRARRARRRCHGSCKSSAGPTPESCSNCGELYAPLDTRISLRARARAQLAALPVFDAPGRGVPSNTMRCASASVSICRLPRRFAGRR